MFSSIKNLIILFLTILLFCYCQNDSGGAKVPVTLSEKSKKITESKPFLIQLFPFEDFEKKLCDTLAFHIKLFYKCKVTIHKSEELPSFAFYKPRNRYKADSLLDFLDRFQSDTIRFTLGLTNKDISTTNEPYDDWGVFGLAQMPGKSCVISTFRLKKNVKSPSHFIERFIKVGLHEIGHNFGLDHCPNKTCMMEDANGKISTVDNEKMEFCNSCKKKLPQE